MFAMRIFFGKPSASHSVSNNVVVVKRRKFTLNDGEARQLLAITGELLLHGCTEEVRVIPNDVSVGSVPWRNTLKYGSPDSLAWPTERERTQSAGHVHVLDIAT